MTRHAWSCCSFGFECIMTLIWRKWRLWLLCVCDVLPVFLKHQFSLRDHPAIALDKIAGFKTGRRTGQMQRTHFPMGTYKENLSGNHHTDTDKHPHSSWFSLDFGVQFAIQGKAAEMQSLNIGDAMFTGADLLPPSCYLLAHESQCLWWLGPLVQRGVMLGVAGYYF